MQMYSTCTMKICVLTTDYTETDHHLKYVDKPRDPGVFDKTNLHTYHVVPLKKHTAARQVLELHSKGEYDVFVNLCEGSLADDVPGVEVVEILHKLNAAYTGADPIFYNLNKLAMKMAAYQCGVQIPSHMFAYEREDVKRAAREIRMPLIVKHHNGHDSVGMTENSRVTTVDQLEKEAEKFISQYGGALIEEFIDGPEFTVLVLANPNDPFDPIVYEPIECQFLNGGTFKHFLLKWTDTQCIKWVPVKDQGTRGRLKDAAKLIFMTCGGTGYGRCDFRLNTSTNELIFLEINANCSVFYSDPFNYGSADHILNFSADSLAKAADFPAKASDSSITGRGHCGFLHKIIENALVEQKRRRKCYRIGFSQDRGFFMHAAEDLPAGHVIQFLEGAPAYLVSRKFANQNWPPNSLQSDWLKSYAYLISPHVYYMWNPDPNEWTPVNHSCDPNAWLDGGLNVVSRRPIKKGEEISLDYATFAVNDAGVEKSFECNCRSVKCRKIVRPSIDCMQAEFLQTYGDHVSDFVRMKINENEKKLHKT